MKNIEVKIKYTNKYGKLNTILYIWYLNRNRFPGGILMKHKVGLWSNGLLQQWGVKYW